MTTRWLAQSTIVTCIILLIPINGMSPLAHQVQRSAFELSNNSGSLSIESFRSDSDVTASSFAEDFSVNPYASDRWQIYRQASESGIWTGGEFYLTRNVRWQSSLLFAKHSLITKTWEASFRYRSGGKGAGVCGDQGGDGISFFFYSNSFIPGAGRIYVPNKGYSVKLDTYTGRYCDVVPGELIDYIAIKKNDSFDSVLKAVSDPRVEDNQWHRVNVRFDNGKVLIKIDNDLLIDYQIESPDYSNSTIGFHAMTGNASNDQVIDDFVLNESSVVPIPFLDLPFDYSYTNFATASLGYSVGRVNSWFDHTSPNYSENNNLTRWDGQIFKFTDSSPSRIGESWYDGHSGIDFARKTDNDLIVAAAPGAVINTVSNPLKTDCKAGDGASCGGGYGNQVWLDHNNGYATLYGHLKTVFITGGISVTAAQSLGIMGNTGISSGTHLHFGLYYDQNGDGQWTPNEVVDPYGWFGKELDSWGVASHYMWQKPLAEQKEVSILGATLDTPSGGAKAAIPPNAVTSTVTVELWNVPSMAQPSAQLRSTGRSVWLRVLDWINSNGPSARIRDATTTFSQPITISINYSDTETLHLDKSQLSIYRWSENSGTWISLSTTLRLEQNQVIAQSTEAGNFDVQAPLLCPADTQEPNDSYYAASLITPNGASQVQLFDVAQDEDWFKLDAIVGAKYIVSTSNLATQVGTALQVYDMDGLTLLALDGNTSNLIGSRLVWSAPASGTYFLHVTQASGSDYGCSASYSIDVIQMQPTFLPFVQR